MNAPADLVVGALIAASHGLSRDERDELLAAERRMAGFSAIALHHEAEGLADRAHCAALEGRWRRVDSSLVILALDLLEQKFLQEYPGAARAHMRALPTA